ncbi:hypothetical protein [Leptolyngbya sp. PCC 6406]|uniref:hypothetical protein n=1 Tax=Leptolyngbya sp. PCC 6406 TaxID=1173264 RepID=UPI0002ACE617|nr:hypothetical protein [Leptolyngbya sp. PCC 6406]
MGLVKKIFGSIFALIGGLLGAVGGVFGLGKKSEFFMELDESAAPAETPASPPAKVEKVAKPEAQTTAPVAPVAESKPVTVSASAQPALTFAPNFLVNPDLTFTSRRRPGPSLSPFRDMARNVKKAPSAG